MTHSPKFVSLQSPSIKYQLPSEPHVYVDLVDDEDTQLMFDEWQEYTTSANRSAAAKLHLFVDWHRRQPLSEASLQKGQLRNLGGSSESIELAPTSLSQEQVQSAGTCPTEICPWSRRMICRSALQASAQ